LRFVAHRVAVASSDDPRHELAGVAIALAAVEAQREREAPKQKDRLAAVFRASIWVVC
jgi:hypothetical protein